MVNLIKKFKEKKVFIKVISSSFLALPIKLLVAMFTYRIIEPYYMGIWAAMTIFETYAGVLRLGVTNGMNRELPFAMGAGQKDKAIAYAQTTLAFNIFSVLILWIITPFILKNFEFNKLYLVCFGVNIMRVSLSFYTVYLSGTFRTTDNFDKLSNIKFITIGANVIMVPLIYFFKFNGYLIMQAALVLTEAILLHAFRPLRIQPRFNFQAFKHLLKIGMPLFITGYFVSFVDTIPKLFILKYSDETHLGLYSPVLMIISIFTLLPTTLSSYYYPRLSFLYGKTKNPKILWDSLKRIYFLSFAILAPLILIAYLLMDGLISFFPKYETSLPYMKAALFVAPFVLSKLGNLVYVVLMKVKYMGLYVFFYGIFQVGFLFIIYYFFIAEVLMSVVISTVLANIALFALSLLFNYRLSMHQNVPRGS